MRLFVEISGTQRRLDGDEARSAHVSRTADGVARESLMVSPPNWQNIVTRPHAGRGLPEKNVSMAVPHRRDW